MPIIVYTPLQQEAPVTAPKHLVTREFVEDLLSGKIKSPVRLVSTNDIPGTYAGSPAFELTTTAAEALHIDGVAVDVGDRVLLAGQTNGTENGIYEIVDAGEDGPTPPATPAILKRAPDFTASDQIEQGQQISVIQGTVNAAAVFKLVTGGIITLDATALEFLPIAPSTGAAKFAETIVGDSTTDSFTINHSLGTRDVIVNLFKLPDHSLVLADIEATDQNNVEIGFAEPPGPADSFRVVVTG